MTMASKSVYNSRELRPELADGKWRDHLLMDQGDMAILETHRLELKWGQGRYVKVLATRRNTGFSKKSRKYTALARLIMNAPDDLVVDHINRNPLDNRRQNLRIVTHSENMRNTQRTRTDRVSCNYRGVTATGNRKKWMSKIKVEGRWHYLGSFVAAEDAARAYDAAARDAHGAFAVLNFPDDGGCDGA